MSKKEGPAKASQSKEKHKSLSATAHEKGPPSRPSTQALPPEPKASTPICGTETASPLPPHAKEPEALTPNIVHITIADDAKSTNSVKSAKSTKSTKSSIIGISGHAVDHSDHQIVDLNVGGVIYTTTRDTLTWKSDSGLAALMKQQDLQNQPVRDKSGKIFIDRDGVLFRYILDYLRESKLVLPRDFPETERLKLEAEYFNLHELATALSSVGTRGVHSPTASPDAATRIVSHKRSQVGPHGRISVQTRKKQPGFITVGYRGTFAFGREGMGDVKFRKLSRIFISGKHSLCREVFQDSLNESRDPDHGSTDHYSGRLFLKHTILELAFESLQEEGFRLVSSCASGTNSAGEVKPGLDTEEAKWQHYNEFIFERR